MSFADEQQPEQQQPEPEAQSAEQQQPEQEAAPVAEQQAEPEPEAQGTEQQAEPEPEAQGTEQQAEPEPDAQGTEQQAEAVEPEPGQPERARSGERPGRRGRGQAAAEQQEEAIPGADLEPDIVPEGTDPLASAESQYDYAVEPAEEPAAEEESDVVDIPVAQAAIDLAAGARYYATGKRKTSVARVILRPGTGGYTINGRPLEGHFPRPTLQRTIRQPLESVGYESRMDVVAKIHGGGVSAQAGALRHGIARALIEADPNLRGELKRRGFLTRDSRVKERKKAGLKKARKRPQFSKR